MKKYDFLVFFQISKGMNKYIIGNTWKYSNNFKLFIEIL